MTTRNTGLSRTHGAQIGEMKDISGLRETLICVVSLYATHSLFLMSRAIDSLKSLSDYKIGEIIELLNYRKRVRNYYYLFKYYYILSS